MGSVDLVLALGMGAILFYGFWLGARAVEQRKMGLLQVWPIVIPLPLMFSSIPVVAQLGSMACIGLIVALWVSYPYPSGISETH